VFQDFETQQGESPAATLLMKTFVDRRLLGTAEKPKPPRNLHHMHLFRIDPSGLVTGSWLGERWRILLHQLT
jgi:hypothetical protein